MADVLQIKSRLENGKIKIVLSHECQMIEHLRKLT